MWRVRGRTSPASASRSGSESSNLFPEGRADLIAFNPPWIPARPRSPIERAIYDPGSELLLRFLKGLPEHLRAARRGSCSPISPSCWACGKRDSSRGPARSNWCCSASSACQRTTRAPRTRTPRFMPETAARETGRRLFLLRQFLILQSHPRREQLRAALSELLFHLRVRRSQHVPSPPRGRGASSFAGAAAAAREGPTGRPGPPPPRRRSGAAPAGARHRSPRRRHGGRGHTRSAR